MRATLVLSALAALLAAPSVLRPKPAAGGDAALRARRAIVAAGFDRNPVWDEDRQRSIDLLVGTQLASAGWALRERSAKRAAAALERRLQQQPDDAAARLVLLGYYTDFGAEPERLARARHARWVLENFPASELAVLPGAFIQPNAPAAKETLAFWRRQVRDHPDDAEIVGNAAQYTRFYDRALAAQLFERAIILQPDRFRWRFEAGRFYATRVWGQPRARWRPLVRLGLARLRQALALLDAKGATASPFYREDVVAEIAAARSAAGS